MDIEMLVKQMSANFWDMQHRCEHCGKEQGVFYCDDCQANMEQFVSNTLDLLILIEADVTRRFHLLLLTQDTNIPRNVSNKIWQSITKP